MAVMDVVIRIQSLQIEKKNEDSRDEPYLIPVYIVFDGHSSPTPLLLQTRKVRIHAPGPAHGSLGPRADGLSAGHSVDVPVKTGRFETQVMTLPGFLFEPANRFTFMALVIVALEEDATSDSAAEAGRQALVESVRKQIDAAVKNPSLSATIDSAQIADEVAAAVIAATIDGWSFAAVSSLFTLGELVDPDDLVGQATLGPLSFRALALAPPSGIPFSRTLTGQGEGRYVVSGAVRRTDHPVTVAAVQSRGFDMVVAREDSRRFFVNEGKPAAGFAEPLPVGTFTSGPAICRSLSRVDIFGRGDDRRFYQAWRTGSGPWQGWEPMADGTFRSGPAALARANGRIDLFGVDDDDHLRFRSFDGHWSFWFTPDSISAGTFLPASPAVASWDDDRIDLFALGKDSRIYHTRTDAANTSLHLGWGAWAPLGNGRFFSGPSAVAWGVNRLDVVALGLDRRCYHLTFENQWTDWSAIHDGTFFAGPGIASRGRNHLEVFAVGDDRRMWRTEWKLGQGWSAWHDDMGNVRFT